MKRVEEGAKAKPKAEPGASEANPIKVRKGEKVAVVLSGGNPHIANRSTFDSRRCNAASAHAAERYRQRQWSKPICDDRGATLRRREISFSQGAKWNALISTYIGTIPLSGEASCPAEHIMSAPPLGT